MKFCALQPNLAFDASGRLALPGRFLPIDFKCRTLGCGFFFDLISDQSEVAAAISPSDPVVGAQGGDVEATVRNGKTADGSGLMINSSRGILYASSGAGYAEAAREAARELRDTINRYR